MVKNCPDCGIDAVYYDEKTKPGAIVECNNCHHLFRFKDLK